MTRTKWIRWDLFTSQQLKQIWLVDGSSKRQNTCLNIPTDAKASKQSNQWTNWISDRWSGWIFRSEWSGETPSVCPLACQITSPLWTSQADSWFVLSGGCLDCLPRIFSPQGQSVNRHTPPPSARAAFVSFGFFGFQGVCLSVRHNRCVYLVTAAARSWREFKKKQ